MVDHPEALSKVEAYLLAIPSNLTRSLFLTTKMADFKMISLNAAMSLLSIPEILKRHKPDLLLLQEIKDSTETVSEIVAKFGYKVECNVDALHPTSPGTAVGWSSGLKLPNVIQLIERRAQSVTVCGETFVNVYAPSGSNNRRERWEFFNELFLHIIQSGSGGDQKPPVLAGDWNAILAEIDTTRNFDAKYCKVLHRIIKNLKYTDCFRHLHPNVREYTFHRGAHVAQSRLDRFYLPPHLLGDLVSAVHYPGLSDHSQVQVELLHLRVGMAGAGRRQEKLLEIEHICVRKP